MIWRFLAVLVGLGLVFAQTLSVSPQGRVGEALTVQGSNFSPGRYILQIEEPSGGGSTVEIEATGGGFSQSFTPGSPGLYRFRVGVIETQSQVLQAATPPAAAAPAAPPTTPSPAQAPQPGPSAPPSAPADQAQPAAPPTQPASPAAPTEPQPAPPAAPQAPAPQSQAPVLRPDGLLIGGWRLPLVGQWSGPRLSGERAFIWQGPLVLEIDLSRPAVAAQHYAPLEVRAVETDPEVALVLDDNRRLTLSALAGRPYEGRWESLEVIRDYFRTLRENNALRLDESPAEERPYWYYFTQEPASLGAAELEAAGRDLMLRGHRPELSWGSGVMRWLQPWLAQVSQARGAGLEKSLQWSEFFVRYMPQAPGVRAMLADQTGWLEAQGRADLATRYREAQRQIGAWKNPFDSRTFANLAWVLLGLYALLLLYLALMYLPSQMRGVAQSGGWLLGWLRHPLLRLRHSMLAYTTLGERFLLLMLFVLAAVSLLGWGFLQRSEALAAQDSLNRGTLRSSAAQETLRGFASSAAMRGLLGYAVARENPEEARRLFDSAPDWTYVLLGRGTPAAIAQAERQAPGSPAVREILGTGGDLWTPVYREAGIPREAVPTPRIVASTVALSGLVSLPDDYLAAWRDLPIWPNAAFAWGVAILVIVLTLYHLLCFFVPRPKTAQDNPGWRRGVQLLFPGSPTYSQGWGLTILLLFGAGVWLGLGGSVGGWVLAGVMLAAHLGLWLGLARR